MKIYVLYLVLITSSFANASIIHGFSMDESESINSVNLKSGSLDDVRVYDAEITRDFDLPFDEIKKVVGNFEERCNNELMEKRKLTNKSKPCMQNNNSLIESVKISKLKYMKSEPFKVKEYILKRRIYNRYHYHHYDLISVKEINAKDGKIVTISIKMLTDTEATRYLGKKPEEKRESAFIDMAGLFTIKQIGKNKTRVTYRYTSKTDHWLLNKSYITGKFFGKTSENLNLLLDQISIRTNTIIKESQEKKKIEKAPKTVSTHQ